MPLIEELPLGTAARAQPGWAYVADTGVPIAAVQPGQRKRGRPADSAASTSAKQRKAIDQRLKDLERENYKDVHIAIPKREGGKREGRKVTSNVRRILGYNRTFAHYLADEEAALQAGQQPYYMQGAATAAATPASGRDARKKTGRDTATSSSGRASAQPGSMKPPPSKPTPSKIKTESQDVEMESSPTAPKSPNAARPSSSSSSQPEPPSYPPEWDKDPLLRTRDLPPRPSDRVMQQLLAEPPLSWNGARAKPLDPENQTPPRHFCIMCGYWGKVKCRKCAERTCGTMECWKAHEAAGCGDRPY